MQFQGWPINPYVWQIDSFVDSQGNQYQLPRPKSLDRVNTQIQMKFEHLRIIYESKKSRKPHGMLYGGTVCVNTELGLQQMRIHYLDKCE